MAKSLLLNILVDVLGKFVDGLSVDNLKFGVFSGKLEFKNLKLKPSALEDLDIPVTITNGSLKQLNLKVPWTSLDTKPVKILVDGLLLQVGPFDVDKLNGEQLRTYLFEAKHRALVRIEEAILRSAEKLEKVQDYNFLHRLAIKIVDNIEISVSNIHIRYEEIRRTNPSLSLCGKARPSYCTAGGFTLQSLNILTTDENGVEKFIIRDIAKDEIHKVGVMNNFSVYWNGEVKNPWSDLSIDEWEVNMLSHIYSGAESQAKMSETMNYIILPPNSVKVNIIHRDRPSDKSIPQVNVNINCTHIEGNMDKLQFRQILETSRSFLFLEHRKQMAKFRPDVRPTKDPKAWWKYAFKMLTGQSEVGAEKVKAMFHCMKLRQRYIELIKAYRRKLLGMKAVHPPAGVFQMSAADVTECLVVNKGSGPLTLQNVNLEASIRKIEALLPYQTLFVYRQLAANDMTAEIREFNAKSKKKKTFMSIFSNSSSSDSLSTSAPLSPVSPKRGSITSSIPFSNDNDSNKDISPTIKKKSSWRKLFSWKKSKSPTPISTPDQEDFESLSMDEESAASKYEDDKSETNSVQGFSDTDDVPLETIEKHIIGTDFDLLDGVSMSHSFICLVNFEGSASFSISAKETSETPVIEAGVTIGMKCEIYSDCISLKANMKDFRVEDRFHEVDNSNKYLVSGISEDCPAKLTFNYHLYFGLIEKSDLFISADPVLVFWNGRCIQRLADVFIAPRSNSAMVAKLTNSLQADSVLIFGFMKKMGTSVQIEAEAPKFIVPYDKERRIVPASLMSSIFLPLGKNCKRGYLLIDTGHLMINGHFSLNMFTLLIDRLSLNMALCKVSMGLYDEFPDLTKSQSSGHGMINRRLSVRGSSVVESEDVFVIKPFNIMMQLQNTDKSVADMTVDCNITPGIHAVLNANKLGNLLRVVSVVVPTLLPILMPPPHEDASNLDPTGGSSVYFSFSEASKVVFRMGAILPVIALDIQYSCSSVSGDCASLVIKDVHCDMNQRSDDMGVHFGFSSLEVFDQQRFRISTVAETKRHMLVWSNPSNLNPFTVDMNAIFTSRSPLYKNIIGAFVDLKLLELTVSMDSYHISRWNPFFVEFCQELPGFSFASETEIRPAAEGDAAILDLTNLRDALDSVGNSFNLMTSNKSFAVVVESNIQQINVQLLRVVWDESGRKPLKYDDAFLLKMQQLNAHIHMHSIEMITAEIALKAIELEDVRECAKKYPFRKLFTQFSGVTSQVSADFDQTENLLMRSFAITGKVPSCEGINAVLCSLKLEHFCQLSGDIAVSNLASIISTDSTLDLIRVIMTNVHSILELVSSGLAVDKVASSIPRRANRRRSSRITDEIEFSVSKKDGVTGKEKPLPFARITASIVNPTIILLEDVTKLDTVCLVSRCELEASYAAAILNAATEEASENLVVSLLRMESFSFNSSLSKFDAAKTSKQEKLRHIVDPMNLECNLARRFTKKQNYSLSVDFEVDDCVSRVSIRDLIFVNKIITQLQLSKSSGVSRKIAILLDEIEGEDSEIVPIQEVPVGGQVLLTAITLYFKFGGFSFTFIDDHKQQYLPVIKFRLQDTEFDASGFSTEMVGSGCFAVNADYYNSKCDTWEPMLEPLQARLNVNWAREELLCELNIPFLTQINVTGVMVRSIFANISIISHLTDPTKDIYDISNTSGSSEAYPFIIMNGLGVPVEIVDPASGRVLIFVPSDGKRVHLPDLGSLIGDGDNNSSGEVFPSTVNLQFIGKEGESWNPLHGLPLDVSNKSIEQTTIVSFKYSLESALEVIYENEKFDAENNAWVDPENDRASRFTLEDLSYVGTLQDVNLPADGEWQWCSNWDVDFTDPNLDDHGWKYGASIDSISDNASGVKLSEAGFRRRKWVRARKSSNTSNSSDLSLSKTVIWDVSLLQDGSRLIHIHSGLQFRNEMPFPVSLLLSSKNNVRGQSYLGTYKSDNIQPNSVIDIPWEYIGYSCLRVRPYQYLSSTYNWSTPLECGSMSTENRRTSWRINDTLFSRNCIVNCEQSGIKGGKTVALRYGMEQSTSGKIVIASVSPVGIVTNCLPCSVNIQIQEEGKDAEVLQIQPGQKSSVLHISSFTNTSCSIKVGSFEWSEKSLLLSKLDQSNKAPGVLRYKSIIDVREKGSLEGSIACSFILLAIVSNNSNSTSQKSSDGSSLVQIFVYSMGAVVDYSGLNLFIRSKRKLENKKTVDVIRSTSTLGQFTALDGSMSTTDIGLWWAEGGNGMALVHSDEGIINVGVNNGSSWSKELSFAVVSPSKVVFEVLDSSTSVMYQLAYSLSPFNGPFSKTNVMSIVPCYRVVNATSFDIELRQCSSNIKSHQATGGKSPLLFSSKYTSIKCKGSNSWHQIDPTIRSTLVQLRCRNDSSNTEWSFGYVDVNAVGSTDILVPGFEGNSPIALHVEVKVSTSGPSASGVTENIDEQSYLTVLIWKSEVSQQTAILSVKNESDYPIWIRQSGVDASKDKKRNYYIPVLPQPENFDVLVNSSSWVPFAWANPNLSATIKSQMVISFNENEKSLEDSEVDGLKFILAVGENYSVAIVKSQAIPGSLTDKIFQFAVNKDETLYVAVQAFGSGSVIRICKSMDRIKLPISQSYHAGLLQTIGRQVFKGVAVRFKFHVEQLSISINSEGPRRRELLSLYLDQIQLHIKHSMWVSTGIDFSISDIQIDSFSEVAMQPVLLQSFRDEYKRQNDVVKSEMPTIQFCLFLEYIPESLSIFVKYFGCRILPLSVCIDSGTLQLLLLDLYPDYRYVSPLDIIASEYPTKYISNFSADTGIQVRDYHLGVVDIDKLMTVAKTNKFYFNEFIVHPIRVEITFIHTNCPPRSVEILEQFTRELYVMNLIGSFVEVKDLPVKLYPFELIQAMLPLESVLRLYLTQFQNDLLATVLRIAGNYFGGLDIIGRPASFIKNVQGGVTGLFYEPYLGIVNNSAEGVLIGIGKGATGLLTGVVSGALDSTAAIVSSAAGKASAAAFMIARDGDYNRTREANKRKSFANDGLIAGLKDGGISVAGGFYSGLSGLVTKPIDGARKQGALGFLKGVGKGVVGAAVKPVLGVTDGLVSVAQGVTNQITVSSVRSKRRPSRAYDRSSADINDLILTQLDIGCCYAQALVMRCCEKEKYLDSYLGFAPLGNDKFIILSDQWIFLYSGPMVSSSYFQVMEDRCWTPAGGRMLTSYITWKSKIANISYCQCRSDTVVECVMYGSSDGSGADFILETAGKFHTNLLYKTLCKFASRFGNPSKMSQLSSAVSDAIVFREGTKFARTNTFVADFKLDEVEAMSLHRNSIFSVVHTGESFAITSDITRVDDGYQFGSANKQPISNVKLPDAKLFERCKTNLNNLNVESPLAEQCQFVDEEIWSLISDFGYNHSNINAARCLVLLLFNNSSQPIEIAEIQVVEGKSYVTIEGYNCTPGFKSLLPAVKGNTNSVGGFGLVFAQGYLPRVLDHAHVTLKLITSAGELTVSTRKGKAEFIGEIGFQPSYYEKSNTVWWSKFVVALS